MPDDSENVPPTDLPQAPAFSPELKAELYALIDSLLDDSIDPVRLQRLEAIVVEHRAAAVLYYELVHLWCILPFHLSRGMIDLTEPGGAVGFATAAMDESMVLPAIRDEDLGEVGHSLWSAPAIASPVFLRPPKAKSSGKWRGSAAAVLLLGVALALTLRVWRRPTELALSPPAPRPPAAVLPPEVVPSPEVPPAVLTASAGAIFDGGSPIKPGTPLAVGDAVTLKQGGIELTFASAAVVVVRGPARVRLVDRNRLALDAGAVTAHVPPSAHGFRIDSPGSTVVDLGTDFGVRSLPGSERSEVDVFNGLVDAAPLDATGLQVAAPVRVATGHAVQLRVADPVPLGVAFAPAQFDRDISTIRMPVRFHGTGVGAAAGAPDPNWQVVSIPGDSAWQPRPAIVVSKPWHMYAPNTPDGRWISLSDPQREVANGEYVLRTTTDLTGIDPATLAVQVRFAVDNHVTDVRVNGVSTGVSTLKMKDADDFGGYLVKLPSAPWHTGLNRVDVVLLNNAFDGSDKPSFMALQATWTASASPVVLR